jgi:hypothetical protein
VLAPYDHIAAEHEAKQVGIAATIGQRPEAQHEWIALNDGSLQNIGITTTRIITVLAT